MIQYRTLKEEELEEWFDHVALVFESTPREYFTNHWKNDAASSVDNIFIAYDDSVKKIASTVRLVPRKIQIDQQVLLAGGIAEVSTRPEYRKQGLAKRLMQIVVDVMRSREMYMGVLSATKAAPFYKTLGWISVPNFWSIQTIPSEGVDYSMKGTKVRAPNYQSKEELHLLVKHHREFNYDFNGLIYRDSEEYYTSWIQNLADGTPSYVLVSSDNDSVVAFASISVQDKTITIKDFATDKENHTQNGGRAALQALIGHAISSSSLSGVVKIRYPSVLFEKLYTEADVTTEKHESFMYKCIDDLAKNSGEVRRSIFSIYAFKFFFFKYKFTD
eukprot:TRINITY_DN506_c0_g1_i1.p1 TRINITY_DN506_c0_g1~~TRINITY_DN506_c0_g1_i1.p1  ORF type:complete len:331 (-),score=90.09 TRINITY_DN506_c0_g1_i1:199-1191(-)